MRRDFFEFTPSHTLFLATNHKPVIKGTRLAVEFIIDLLAQGWTEQDILRNYPGITREDIQACLAYARETLKVEKVYSFPRGGK